MEEFEAMIDAKIKILLNEPEVEEADDDMGDNLEKAVKLLDRKVRAVKKQFQNFALDHAQSQSHFQEEKRKHARLQRRLEKLEEE